MILLYIDILLQCRVTTRGSINREPDNYTNEWNNVLFSLHNMSSDEKKKFFFLHRVFFFGRSSFFAKKKKKKKKKKSEKNTNVFFFLNCITKYVIELQGFHRAYPSAAVVPGPVAFSLHRQQTGAPFGHFPLGLLLLLQTAVGHHQGRHHRHGTPSPQQDDPNSL